MVRGFVSAVPKYFPWGYLRICKQSYLERPQHVRRGWCITVSRKRVAAFIQALLSITGTSLKRCISSLAWNKLVIWEDISFKAESFGP